MGYLASAGPSIEGWGSYNCAVMEEIYNDTRITAVARQLEDGKWTADAEFDVTPGDHRIVSQIPPRQYATSEKAERAAISQAKRMLDRRGSK
jgi:hypothetical protein